MLCNAPRPPTGKWVRGSITIEPLASHHDRKAFSCGVAALDRYLKEPTQDIKRRVSNCFVAIREDGNVVGYYTFAAASLPQ